MKSEGGTSPDGPPIVGNVTEPYQNPLDFLISDSSEDETGSTSSDDEAVVEKSLTKEEDVDTSDDEDL